jgi:uncharacterized RDD family membrane protein YckC
MIDSFCQNCGQRSPQNMRICPQCGGRSFAERPAASRPQSKSEFTPSQTKYVSNSSTNSGPVYGMQNTPAKHFPRLIAAIIDSLLSQGAIYIGTLVLVPIFKPETPSGKFATYFIFAMVVATLYYSIQHSSLTQATVGKRLMGLKLITLSGDPVSFALAIWRALLPSLIFVSATAIFGVVSVPMIMLADNAPSLQTSAASAFLAIYCVMIFVPVLLVFGNPAHKTLFDLICKTRVIQA